MRPDPLDDLRLAPPILRCSRVTLCLKYLNIHPSSAVVCALPVACLAIAIGVMVRDSIVLEWRYYTEAVAASGRVVEIQSEAAWRAGPPAAPLAATTLFAHGGGRPGYRVSYQFVDRNGKLHTSTVRVQAAHGEHLRPGDTIPIAYLPLEPNHNRPDFPKDVGFAIGWCAVLSAFTFIVFLLYRSYRLLGELAERVRIVATGLAVRAEIQSVRVRHNRGTYAGAEVRYEYECEGLGIVGGQSTMTCLLPAGWKPGAEIVVLVDPLDPRRSEADLFKARILDGPYAVRKRVPAATAASAAKATAELVAGDAIAPFARR